MGVNAEFRVKTKYRREPVAQFLELIAELDRSGMFSDILRFKIRQNHYLDVLEDLPEPKQNDYVSYEQILDLLQQYQGDNLAVEIWYEAPMRFEIEDRTRLLIQNAHRAVFTVVGRDFHWAGIPSDIDLVYEIGKDIRFHPGLWGEAAQRNIKAVLHELLFLTSIGAVTIQGVVEHGGSDPRTSFLCYYQHLHHFYHDLGLELNSSIQCPLTKEDILQAISNCHNIDFVETNDNPIIYHRDFVEGNLSEFYQELSRLAKVD